MKITKGTLLTLETGEYSDYTFHGPFTVIREFDQAKAVEQFRAQWVAPNEWTDEPDADQFMGWLNREGYIEPAANVFSWHIGSFGSFKAEPSDGLSKSGRVDAFIKAIEPPKKADDADDDGYLPF